MDASGVSPLRKAALTNMVMAETGSVASYYEDDFDTYADEMEEEDEVSKEMQLYKVYLTEDAELVKGIISSASGEVSLYSLSFVSFLSLLLPYFFTVITPVVLLL